MGEGGKNLLGLIPAKQIEKLEGLVRKVDRVATVDKDMVGDRRAHKTNHHRDPSASRNAGGQHPFSTIAVTGVDEPTVPRGEPFLADPGMKWRQRKTRSSATSVADTKASPCTRARARSAGASTGRTSAMAVSTVKPGPQPSCRLRIAIGRRSDGSSGALIGPKALEKAEDGLGRYERQVHAQGPLRAGPNGGQPGRRRVRTTTKLSFPLDFDAVGPYVVREGVERPPRLQVEAGVVPVTGQQSVLDGPAV